MELTKDRLNISYIIKAKSGKDTLYYDAVNGGWTTITHCTKFYLKRDAMKAKDKVDNDWMRDVEVVKCKIEEIT